MVANGIKSGSSKPWKSRPGKQTRRAAFPARRTSSSVPPSASYIAFASGRSFLIVEEIRIAVLRSLCAAAQQEHSPCISRLLFFKVSLFSLPLLFSNDPFFSYSYIIIHTFPLLLPLLQFSLRFTSPFLIVFSSLFSSPFLSSDSLFRLSSHFLIISSSFFSLPLLVSSLFSNSLFVSHLPC